MAMRLHAGQQRAQTVLQGPATHIMLYGGSRSGKTALLTRNVIARALKAPKSRHAILRFRFNACKQAIALDTFPSIMSLAYPDVKFHVNQTDWFVTLPNGSEVWFGGLDDKERVEKILGKEYATIYLNEASQISWSARNVALTRLAQLATQQIEGAQDRPLRPRMYYDCNPPSKAHWTYRLFHDLCDPETRVPLTAPADYAWCQINPTENEANLAPGYLDTLRSMSGNMKRRFLLGEFADATPGALFSEEAIDQWRCDDMQRVPQLTRIVVGVDPSGADDPADVDKDEIGIVVAGIGIDGNAYVLEDATLRAGPATWGRMVVTAYTRHEADMIVAEGNFGGAMVAQTIEVAKKAAGLRLVPFKLVSASRGKHVRAEPFAALYAEGKIRHVGHMRELEDELCAFSTAGYTGDRSPNRADALIWALAELFPGLMRRVEPEKPAPRERYKARTGQGSVWTS